MKKHILFALCMAWCISASACGKGDSNNIISASDTETSTSVDTALAEPEEILEAEEREDEFEVSEDLLSVTLGKYEQNNILENGTEPIEWIILYTEDDKALVVSKYVLDCQPFNKGFSECTWENSSVRTWLNTDFYDNAFSQGEKEKILLSFVPDKEPVLYDGENDETISDEGETASSADGVESSDEQTLETSDISDNETDSEVEPEEITGTEDYVFLLSDYEVRKYLPDDKDKEGDEPFCKATKYAVSQGVWTLTEDIYNIRNYKDAGIAEDLIGSGWWWLRTSGDSTTKALDVDTDGQIRINGHDVGECHDGIRPAMWIYIK